MVKVKSSKNTIKDMSSLYRKNMQCKIIGITGSNGKTTTTKILENILYL